MQPTDELTVTMQAQQWETVLRLLDEVPAPHRVTAPLLASIQQQCMLSAQMNAVPQGPGNGIGLVPPPGDSSVPLQ
jgi:hypothetical protein